MDINVNVKANVTILFTSINFVNFSITFIPNTPYL